MKVTVPIFAETEIEDFIPKIIEFWEMAKKLKQHYPSVWGSMKSQFNLDWGNNKISKELYEKKLEIMILQDEERRIK